MRGSFAHLGNRIDICDQIEDFSAAEKFLRRPDANRRMSVARDFAGQGNDLRAECIHKIVCLAYRRDRNIHYGVAIDAEAPGVVSRMAEAGADLEDGCAMASSAETVDPVNKIDRMHGPVIKQSARRPQTEIPVEDVGKRQTSSKFVLDCIEDLVSGLGRGHCRISVLRVPGSAGAKRSCERNKTVHAELAITIKAGLGTGDRLKAFSEVLIKSVEQVR